MTRTELIDDLAQRTGLEKKDVKVFLDSLLGVIEDEIKRGGEVPLKGLGKFKVQHRKARVGRNPITGEPLTISERRVVNFKPSAILKTTLNES